MPTDHETPTPISQLEKGHRIAISSVHCLNPSMGHLAKKHVPVTCQVAFIEKTADGWLIEGIDCKLYQIRGNPMVKRLIPVASSLDEMKPAGVGVGELFGGVSIE